MSYQGRDGGMVLPLSRQDPNIPLGELIVRTVAYLGRFYPDKCNKGEAVELHIRTDGMLERYLVYGGVVVQRVDEVGLITKVSKKDTIRTRFGKCDGLEIYVPKEQPVLTRE